MNKFKIIVIILIFSSTSVFAKENVIKKNVFQFLDTYHERITNRVSDRAQWFDNFFGTNRLSEDNGTILRFSLGPEWSEDEHLKWKAQLRAKFDLPNLSEHLKLIIISDTEDELIDNIDGSSLSVEQKNRTRKNFVASALRWSIDFSKKHRVDLDMGIKFRLPMSPFARAHYDKVWQLNPDWRMTFSETVFGVINDESGETTRFDFDRKITKKMWMRVSNWATWSDESQGVDLHQSLSFYQHLSNKSALSYSAGWKSITEPYLRSESYHLNLHFRQNAFRPWIFFIVKPSIEYTRTNDWNDLFRIEFAFQAIFGKLKEFN